MYGEEYLIKKWGTFKKIANPWILIIIIISIENGFILWDTRICLVRRITKQYYTILEGMLSINNKTNCYKLKINKL